MLRARSNSAPLLEIEAPPSNPAVRVGGLVLTRRVDQSIMIGDEIAVEVVEARSSTVRLRVVAPREVRVHRREVYDAIQATPRIEIDLPSAPSETPNRGGGGLVLSRHVDQSIMIGDSIEIIVVGLKSGTARLRVIAPREVPVHRLEIYDAIHA